MTLLPLKQNILSPPLLTRFFSHRLASANFMPLLKKNQIYYNKTRGLQLRLGISWDH